MAPAGGRGFFRERGRRTRARKWRRCEWRVGRRKKRKEPEKRPERFKESGR